MAWFCFKEAPPLVVANIVVVHGDVDSIGTEQVGSVPKIDPAELKEAEALLSLREGGKGRSRGRRVWLVGHIRSIPPKSERCRSLGSKQQKPWIQTTDFPHTTPVEWGNHCNAHK
jgi:hypothetical protein